MLLKIDMVLGYVAAAGVVGSVVCCAIGYERAAYGCALLCGCAWLLAIGTEAVLLRVLARGRICNSGGDPAAEPNSENGHNEQPISVVDESDNGQARHV
jgi:hypothetical protein